MPTLTVNGTHFEVAGLTSSTAYRLDEMIRAAGRDAERALQEAIGRNSDKVLASVVPDALMADETVRRTIADIRKGYVWHLCIGFPLVALSVVLYITGSFDRLWAAYPQFPNVANMPEVVEILTRLGLGIALAVSAVSFVTGCVMSLFAYCRLLWGYLVDLQDRALVIASATFTQVAVGKKAVYVVRDTGDGKMTARAVGFDAIGDCLLSERSLILSDRAGNDIIRVPHAGGMDTCEAMRMIRGRMPESTLPTQS